MEYIADLHIHSPFSRATSKQSTLNGLFAWAHVKGIHLIGTGDFTHPGWLSHLKENLTPAEPGFFKLKNENVPLALPGTTPEEIPVRFVLTAEISSIYKRGGKVRKIHTILYAPDFQSVENINAKLAAIGNIESDGRPILGLDARNLLEILLEHAPEGFLVPAHIWTPWFSLFGSKSGFDAIEDCFGDLTDHIFALETGLSSDPEMNRRISGLDRFTLISNSDCHSPSKLGREANFFHTDFNYFNLREALKDPTRGFLGTVEFFPEEGKYHLDGHRKCDVCLEPVETRKMHAICPVCKKPLTVGVLHRVMELADRQTPVYPQHGSEISYLIPLSEVLGEIISLGPATKGVTTLYGQLISRFGSEFNILLKTPLEELNRESPILGEAVKRIRTGEVIRHGGYDGEFGVINVFEQGELDSLAGQISLFSGRKTTPKKKKNRLPEYRFIEKQNPETQRLKKKPANKAQHEAIQCTAKRILITAGPGTGKTFTLVERISHLISAGIALPEHMVAITFTNRAAAEVRDRLQNKITGNADKIFIGTFHSFCLEWLRKKNPDITVIGPEDRELLLKKIFPNMNKTERSALAREISHMFEQTCSDKKTTDANPEKIQAYRAYLGHQNALDLDGIIPHFNTMLQNDSQLQKNISRSVRFLFVDEFQDINRSQYELVEQLGKHAEIFAIGDPNQAIYGFRGSDLRFFLAFGKDSQTTSINLIENYRSGSSIIDAATAVITHNTLKSNATVKPQPAAHGTIEYYKAPTPKAEAEFVVQKIEKLLGGVSHFSINSGRSDGDTGKEKSFADIAVLYRLSSQAEPLGEALDRLGIPVQIIGAPPFFMNTSIRAGYYWIKTAAQQASIPEQLVLLRSCKGIGRQTIDDLESHLALDTNIFDIVSHLPANKSKTLLNELQNSLNHFRQLAEKKGLVEAIKNKLPQLGVDLDHDDSQRFFELAGIFGNDLQKFSRHLEQNAQATVYDERAEAVSLMTLHGAKGLEFPVIFITGLEEGIMPYTAGSYACDLEEERRLFYVGMTRSQENLILTSAANRTLYGKKLAGTVSRFVTEIPENLYTEIIEKRKAVRKPASIQMKLF
jgi:uncharacterized protein (TIGR00375 family)